MPGVLHDRTRSRSASTAAPAARPRRSRRGWRRGRGRRRRAGTAARRSCRCRAVPTDRAGRDRGTAGAASRRASSRRRWSVAAGEVGEQRQHLVGIVEQALSTAASSSSPTSGETCSKRGLRAELAARRRAPARLGDRPRRRPRLRGLRGAAGRPGRGCRFSRGIRLARSTEHLMPQLGDDRLRRCVTSPRAAAPARTARRSRCRGRRRTTVADE